MHDSIPLGWTTKIPLRQGIESAYAWFRDDAHIARGTRTTIAV